MAALCASLYHLSTVTNHITTTPKKDSGPVYRKTTHVWLLKGFRGHPRAPLSPQSFLMTWERSPALPWEPKRRRCGEEWERSNRVWCCRGAGWDPQAMRFPISSVWGWVSHTPSSLPTCKASESPKGTRRVNRNIIQPKKKKRETLTQAVAGMNLEDILPSEISPSQKDKSCMTALTWGA